MVLTDSARYLWGTDKTSIPIPIKTRTREHGYGFQVGVGAGTCRVTHGLPVMGPIDDVMVLNSEAPLLVVGLESTDNVSLSFVSRRLTW